jgi:hypothetical protein
MPVEVSVRAVEPMPTAVVTAAATWAEFPKMWGPMLDKDDVPNVEVGVQVNGSFEPAGDVVPSALPGRLAGRPVPAGRSTATLTR